MSFELLPFEVLFRIFSYLSTTKDLCRCSAVCRRWKSAMDEEDYTWTQVLDRVTPPSFRLDKQIVKLQGAKTKLIAYENAWSKEDRSPQIYLLDNELTMHRSPIAQSTDAIRGKCGYLYGEHYWTVTWHKPDFGSNSVIGIATEKEVLHKNGYSSLLGSSCESWGWDISNRVLRYEDNEFAKYPQSSVKVKIGQTIGVTLNMDAKTLSFDLEGKYLGEAFTMLPPRRLYPAVSTVFGNSEISLVYQGPPLVG